MNRMAPAVLCDRKTTNIPNSQVNFSKVLVLPTFKLLNNVLKILAEYFLPASGENPPKKMMWHKVLVKEKENDEKTAELAGNTTKSFGMTLELPGMGKSPRHKINLDKFRKESLRPNAEINSDTVLKQCKEFEEIWNGHMEQNREKWTVEQEKGTFSQ